MPRSARWQQANDAGKSLSNQPQAAPSAQDAAMQMRVPQSQRILVPLAGVRSQWPGEEHRPVSMPMPRPFAPASTSAQTR